MKGETDTHALLRVRYEYIWRKRVRREYDCPPEIVFPPPSKDAPHGNTSTLRLESRAVNWLTVSRRLFSSWLGIYLVVTGEHSNQNRIRCVNIRECMFLGSIVGSDYFGMVWYGMVWYGMVWYGMAWYGMVWYSMV